MRFRLTLLALTLLGSAPVLGLEPRLVKDINPAVVPQGSFPQDSMKVGSLAFFTADDGESGRELWRTDGTEAGTFRVADVCPGTCNGNPVLVAQTGRLLFFTASEQIAESTVSLWVTDGSRGGAGTVRLAGALVLPSTAADPARGPLPVPGPRSLWVPSQGVLYFTAGVPALGPELWRTDGTAGGTFPVLDLRPGAGGSDPRHLTEAGGRLFFTADPGELGPSLWTSDGTAGGTRLVKDPLPGVSQEGPALLRALGGALYFVAPVTRDRAGVWKTDGTAAGTILLRGFPLTPNLPPVLDAAVLGNRLLFVAYEPATGYELWASEGTRRTTRRLTSSPETLSVLPFFTSDSPLTAPFLSARLGSRLLFRFNDRVNGPELWSTDGTPQGTRMLHDTLPGAGGGVGSEARVAGSTLFFTALSAEHGTELWAADGTTDGTRMVGDLCQSVCSSSPFSMKAGPDGIFFLANDFDSVPQLWQSNGTAQGTVQLTSFPDAHRHLSLGLALGERFLFAASNAGHNVELWKSDGTRQGTRLFLDLNPSDGGGGSFPAEMRTAGGKAWFFANDGVHGYELWSSDGTEAGTRLAHEFVPGAGPDVVPGLASAAESGGRLFFLIQQTRFNLALWAGEAPGSFRQLTPPGVRPSPIEPLRALGNRVYFVAHDPHLGEELWSSDGTPEGTRMIDLQPGAAGSFPGELTPFQGRLFFTARFGESDRALWATDGTPRGTVLVKVFDFRLGLAQLLTEHAGRLYFSAGDEIHGQELWSTDGTPAGTTLEADLNPGPRGFSMRHLISAGSRLFFSGAVDSIESPRGLYVSDGTAAGSRRISPQLMMADDIRPSPLPVVFEGRLFFTSPEDLALWVSDGTEEGTHQLLDASGQKITDARFPQVFDGRLFFTSQNGGLYQTDGTSAGTLRLLDLQAPLEDHASFELVRVGDRLLVRRWNPLTGSELWALEE